MAEELRCAGCGELCATGLCPVCEVLLMAQGAEQEIRVGCGEGRTASGRD